MLRQLPTSTLFPYTTLFRSCNLTLDTTLRDQIIEAQRKDEGMTYIRANLAKNKDSCFRVDEEGVIWFKHRLVVPKEDRKSTRLNSSHRCISYAVFCLKKKTM